MNLDVRVLASPFSHPRVGIVVPRHRQSAVDRNRLKRRIRELVAEGRSDEEIRGFFVERYGTWILLDPPKSGFNLAAWLLPGAAVLAGAVGLVFAARRWASRSPARASVEPPPESPYLDRLEQELKETE